MDKTNGTESLPQLDFFKRIKQELKRAERYCEFLSLLVIDLSGMKKISPKNHLKNIEIEPHFSEQLEDWIKRNVRETDIISEMEEGKLGLLLAETPKDGALNLANRLKDSIKSHFGDLFKVSSQWMIPVEIISFPDREQGKEKFLDSVEKIFSH
jgi:GGDEF domain-containing protein